VTVTWDDNTLRFTLIADEYPTVELWETERYAVPLIEEAFGRRVILNCIAAPYEWPEAL